MNPLDAIIPALQAASGPALALTIERLALIAGVGRREMEQLIEDRIGDLPFLVVAGGRGYYRPTEAKQINGYLSNLHSRHRRLQVREQRVRRRARLDGWDLAPSEKRFEAPPSQASFPFAAEPTVKKAGG
jgi:hypothetical protein